MTTNNAHHDDAIHGVEMAPCHDCAGFGYTCERTDDGDGVCGSEAMCSTCDGSGNVLTINIHPFVVFAIVQLLAREPMPAELLERAVAAGGGA